MKFYVRFVELMFKLIVNQHEIAWLMNNLFARQKPADRTHAYVDTIDPMFARFFALVGFYYYPASGSTGRDHAFHEYIAFFHF